MKHSSSNRIYIIGACIFLAILPLVSGAQPDEAAIRQLLARQSDAWSRGSIDEFMKGYWNSDSLLFIGKNGVKHGYNSTLENYKKNYPDTATMGKLRFNLLNLKKLSPEYYFVVGKWNLQRSKGDLEGHFTLLFKKIRNRWVIVADHSS